MDRNSQSVFGITKGRHTMNNIAHLDTTVLDTVAKFFRTMQKAGANFTGPTQSIVKRRNLVSYLQKGCPKLSDNGEVVNEFPEGHELARLILGDNYITPKEMTAAYNFNYTDEQLEHFADTLPDLETLAWLNANDYILVATSPTKLNLLQIRELDNNLFYSKTKRYFVIKKEKFAKTNMVKAGGWLAIRKKAVPNSFRKTWKEQQDLITKVESVPNASEVSYAVTAYYKIRGIYLLRSKYVRTSSVDAGGVRVCVGLFGEDGLSVNGRWDYDRVDGGLGVASYRE